MTTANTVYNTSGTYTFVAPSTLLSGSVVTTVRGGKGAPGGNDGDGSGPGGSGGSDCEVQATVPLSSGGSLGIYVASSASGQTGGSGYHTGGNGGNLGHAGTGRYPNVGGGGGGSSAITNGGLGGSLLIESPGGGGGGGGWSSCPIPSGGGNGAVSPVGPTGSGVQPGAGANGEYSGGGGGGGGVTGNGGNGSGSYASPTPAPSGGGSNGMSVYNSARHSYDAYPSISGAGGQAYANTGAGVAAVTYTTEVYYSPSPSVVVQYTYADTPSAPTLVSPSSSSTVNNASSGLTFSWTYNPGTDSGSENAYALRLKLGAGSYQYWNASTQLLQTSIVWNSSSSTSVTIPLQTLQGGGSYVWSVATQESYYSLQSAFAADSGFTAQATIPLITSISTHAVVAPITLVTTINLSTSITDSLLVAFSSSQPAWSPGVLSSVGVALPTSVQSLPYLSYHNVIGVQFATIQSDSLQLISNDHFTNGSTGWTSVGAGIMTVDTTTQSLIINQAQTTTVSFGHSLIRPPVSPVMAESASSVSASTAGIISPAVTPSANGTLYAAVKVTPLTSLHNPLLLQLINANTTAVLNTWQIVGYPNQQQVQVFPFQVGEFAPSGTPLQLQLVESTPGASSDVWSVQALSLFDEGMYWQFSPNGGYTWYAALGVKNNPYGYVQFTNPGNQLVWKVTFYQPNLSLNELEIRPVYAGSPFLDQALGLRGATVEFTDNFVQIDTDPLFNQSQLPIPRSWYATSSVMASTTTW